MRIIVLAALLSVGLAGPVLACGDAEEILFACETDTGGTLELCGAGDGDSFRAARLAASDANGNPLLSFPAEPEGSLARFRFSHADGPGGYRVSIRFADQANRYTLFSDYQPPAPDDPYDMGGGDAGLLIATPQGQVEQRLSCGERPYEFIETMRQAFPCDTNPYGVAGCAFAPAIRPSAWLP